MKYLFLDANILLDFYRFGDDDISAVGKLVVLIKDKEITLFSNQQLKSEVGRNREKVLAESLKSFENAKFAARHPNYCANLHELKILQDKLKEANLAHQALVAKVKEMIKGRTLPADQLITTLFDGSTNLAITEMTLTRARVRHELGNPPGKRESLGDSVHWETLLDATNARYMDLVSRDGDFASELAPDSIKSTLTDEWMGKKGQYARVKLFKSLSDYLKAHYPQIKLTDEAEKNDLIAQLLDSPNFASTHSIVKKLDKFGFFTAAQVNRLFQALVNNSQVGWIATDADVLAFYMKLKDQSHNVAAELHSSAATLLEVEEDDFFFPF